MDYFIDIQTTSLDIKAKIHTLTILKVDKDIFSELTLNIDAVDSVWFESKPENFKGLDINTLIKLLPNVTQEDKIYTFNGSFVTNALYNTFGSLKNTLGVRHIISLMDLFLWLHPHQPINLNAVCTFLNIPIYTSNIFKYYAICSYINQKTSLSI